MRTVKKLLSLLLTLIVLAAVVQGGIWLFRENYFLVDRRVLWRHARTMDLSGYDLEQLDFLREFTRLETIDARGCPLEPEQYDRLCREYPQCTVEWDIPFQGRRYSTQTQRLSVTSLTERDLELLAYFPDLKSVDGWDCPDYGLLFRLQQQRPDCKVFYDVPISGQNFDCDITELPLENVDLAELEEKLQYLPKVQTLHLMGTLPDMEQVQALLKKYPRVALSWQVDLGEAVLEMGATHLNLAGFPQENVELVEKLIPYLPALQEVDLTGCGVEVAQLADLARRHPRIRFLYDVTVGPVQVRSDARQIDLSGHAIEDLAAIEQMLPCLTELERVIMCGCGIPSAEMEDLGKRHPQIRFVWTVNLGGLEVRTDATYFIPTKYDVDVSNADLEELRYCVDMIGVDVGHMKGVTHCEWAAYMPKLKYLILADTNVWDLTPLTGLENLVFLELFLTRVQDTSPLLTCTGLEDLNLCYTYADPEPVTRMTWLKRVWWAGNWNAKVRYGDAFRENLPDCTFNFDTESSTGEGWRKGKNYYAMRDLFGMNYMTW